MHGRIVQIYLFSISSFTICITQESTGRLHRRILDSDRNPIFNARIQSKSESLEYLRETVTNEMGYFYALKIHEGHYTITISYVGKQKLICEDVLTIGKTTNMGEIILNDSDKNSILK